MKKKRLANNYRAASTRYHTNISARNSFQNKSSDFLEMDWLKPETQ